MKIINIDVASIPAPVPSDPWATKTAFEIIEDMLSISSPRLVRMMLAGTPAAAILEKYLSGGFDS